VRPGPCQAFPSMAVPVLKRQSPTRHPCHPSGRRAYCSTVSSSHGQRTTSRDASDRQPPQNVHRDTLCVATGGAREPSLISISQKISQKTLLRRTAPDATRDQAVLADKTCRILREIEIEIEKAESTYFRSSARTWTWGDWQQGRMHTGRWRRRPRDDRQKRSDERRCTASLI
jgi:hypothetical protein